MSKHRPVEDESGETIWENVINDCGHYADEIGNMDEREMAQHARYVRRLPLGQFGCCRTQGLNRTRGRFNYRWRQEVV